MVKNLTFDRLVGTTLGNYRLEQLIEQNNSQLVFLARSGDATITYLLRILAVPAGPPQPGADRLHGDDGARRGAADWRRDPGQCADDVRHGSAAAEIPSGNPAWRSA